MSKHTVPLFSMIALIVSWASLGLENRALSLALFWLTIALCVVSVVQAALRRGTQRWFTILGGLCGAGGMLSFTFVGDGSINIAGFVAALAGVVLLAAGLITRPPEGALH